MLSPAVTTALSAHNKMRKAGLLFHSFLIFSICGWQYMTLWLKNLRNQRNLRLNLFVDWNCNCSSFFVNPKSPKKHPTYLTFKTLREISAIFANFYEFLQIFPKKCKKIPKNAKKRQFLKLPKIRLSPFPETTYKNFTQKS